MPVERKERGDERLAEKKNRIFDNTMLIHMAGSGGCCRRNEKVEAVAFCLEGAAYASDKPPPGTAGQKMPKEHISHK